MFMYVPVYSPDIPSRFKIHLISLDFPWPSIALLVQNHGLKHHSFIFPVASADFTLFGYVKLFHNLISLGKMQHIFCSCCHSHSTNFHFTWCPLLPLDLGSNALTTQHSSVMSKGCNVEDNVDDFYSFLMLHCH